MPFSDNLYSMNEDESETESFSEELSPTDGYFTRRSMPTDVMVPDPSQRHKLSEDKVLIPARDARPNSELASRTTDSPTLSQLYPSHANASSAAASSKTPSSPSNTPSSPVSSRRTAGLESEHTPLLRAPPPAYSAAAESSPPASPTSPEARSYSTFPAHQLEQGFTPQHEPQSMGRPIDEPTERSPLSGGSPEEGAPFPTYARKKSSLRRVFLRKFLFFALVIAVMIALLTSMGRWRTHVKDKDTPSHGYLPSGPYCSSATIKQEEDIITFDLGTNQNLAVVQTTHEGDGSSLGSHVTTSGEIRLRLLPKDSKRGPYLSIDVWTSDPELEIEKTWDLNAPSLLISTPRRARLERAGGHCISVEITAWLPEDAQFTSLRVSSTSLTLRVVEDLKINIMDDVHFGTISGGVMFPTFHLPKGKQSPKSASFDIPGHKFNSRTIDIGTVSGIISGLFPLYDHLGLHTESGSVAVGVVPHSIDPAAPVPAELIVRTTSGNINVHLPVLSLANPKFNPPHRDYKTQISAVSGGISGSYYLGSSARFSSTSGTISLTVQPIINSSEESAFGTTQKSIFETRSESGSTDVSLLEPIFISLFASKEPLKQKVSLKPIANDDPYLVLPPSEGQLFDEEAKLKSEEGKLRSLRSSHGTTSGTISVKYPPAYEGTIFAKSITGSISVGGDGVKTIHEKNGWASKEVLARKGVKKEGKGSSVELKSMTGSLGFDIYNV